MGSKSTKAMMSVIWLLMLIFLAWPVAGFCAAWWVFFIALEKFHPVVPQITGFLESIMTWPRDVGAAILTGQSSFPKPF
jgi:hypothetical protein